MIAHGSKRWSRGLSKRSETDRKCVAVMWVVTLSLGATVHAHHGQFGVDLALQKPISQMKYHRWALRLMEHDITLKWRPGTQHQLPDAISRLPNKTNLIEDFEKFFPGDESLPNVHLGPQGAVLDGVHLETLGVEDVGGSSTQSPTVRAAVALTPADPSETDTQQTKLVIAPERPVVVMLDCAGGSSILALERLLTVRGGVYQNWRTLECIREKTDWIMVRS